MLNISALSCHAAVLRCAVSCILLFAAEVAHCNITANLARMAGGGIYISDSARLNLSDSRLVGNSAGWHGGGTGLWRSSGVRLSRVLLARNSAKVYGGAVSTGYASTLTMLTATVHNNSASKHGDMGCSQAMQLLAQARSLFSTPRLQKTMRMWTVVHLGSWDLPRCS